MFIFAEVLSSENTPRIYIAYIYILEGSAKLERFCCHCPQEDFMKIT